jgi:hypothetical protein
MNNVLYLVRRSGIPALAYPVTDASMPWPCSLVILHSELVAQFTVSLKSYIPIHGVNDEQLFTLRFEGDNLMPGKSSLERVNIPLSAEWLDSIARQGQPRVKTLSLTLKAPCSVWYPRTLGIEASSIDTPSRELTTLAKATKVHILFDTNWLGRDNLARLRRAVEGSLQLTGVPVIPDSNFTLSYQKADWSILNFVEDAKSRALPPDEDTAPEAVLSVEDELVRVPLYIEDAVPDPPPSYDWLSSKRPRHGESSRFTSYRAIINAHHSARGSLTPDSPSPKRVLLEDPTCLPLPPKRATSVSSLSAKSTNLSTATVHVDVFQEAITTAVERLLPGVLRDVLPDIIRDILPRLLTASQSPSSSPGRPPPCRPHPTSQLPTVPTISALLSTHVSTYLNNVYVDALGKASDEASELHNSIGVEISELLDEHKIDLAIIKEDAIAELSRECDEKLVEFKEHVADVQEEVEIHADKVMGKVCDRLDVMEMQKEVQCRCIGFHDAKKQEPGKRSVSLPL